MRKASKRIPLNDSALFKLTSPRRLADKLCITIQQLDFLCSDPARHFNIFETKKGRLVQEPKALMKRVHARFARLLGQIETPEYLHSAVRKRSYLTNADAHDVDGRGVKLDIKKFFPSARAQAVYHFFLDQLLMPPHVAGIATKILTFNGHLPTGGNASPILSFWAYKPMFDEIADLANALECKFTLYIDDMTLTGRYASRNLQYKAAEIIRRYRLKSHKKYAFGPGQPRVVTGVAVTKDGSQLPVKRQRSVADDFRALNAAQTPEEQLAVTPRLIGRLSGAAEIDPTWEKRKRQVVELQRSLRTKSAET